MTDKKASEENPAANVADADFWAGVKGGLDVRFSFAQVKTWIKAWITKSDVGLANVDNTSDADKPVSTATQTALNLKANTSSLGTAAAAATTDFATAAQGGLADTAVQPGDLTPLAPLDSPTFTGTPTAPTASPGNNSGQIATTEYVDNAVTESTTGVASIAGNTGAFTLSTGITNSGNDIRLDRGQLPGEASNGNASAGNVGEFISSEKLVGAAVALTTGANANLTSISLTAGDWDLFGNVALSTGGTTTISYLIFATSQTSAAYSASAPRNGFTRFEAFATGSGACVPLASHRISLSAPATIYLVVTCGFATSTCAVYGTLSARRAR